MIELAVIILLVFVVLTVTVTTAFAAIDSVEKYAKEECEQEDGKWSDHECDIKDESERLNYQDRIAKFEDDICDNGYNKYQTKEERSLCKEGNTYNDGND